MRNFAPHDRIDETFTGCGFCFLQRRCLCTIHERPWFGYPKKENPDLWAEASPLAHVGKNTPPILFINSAVPWMHAGREDFRKVLHQYGIYSEVHSFDDAPHPFPLFDPWFEPMLNDVTDLLKRFFDDDHGLHISGAYSS